MSSEDNGHTPNEAFRVDLPAGGTVVLESADEMDLWNEHKRRYIEDYGFQRLNDLMHLGNLLTYAIHAHRATQLLSDPKKAEQGQSRLTKATDGIERIEKLLGIDKKSRESGGKHTVDEYLDRLLRAAHMKGIHISRRVREMERVWMELSWKVRLLRNGDEEDRRHHDVSESKIIDWLERELIEMEEKDKTWAREQGAIFVGKL